MGSNVDIFLDRAKLKKDISKWRNIAIIAFFSLLLVLVGKFTFSGSASGSYIAEVNVENVIFEDQERLSRLNKIKNDKSVKAVILRVNSPGGTVVGGETLYNTLHSLSKEKPLIVIMGSLAASGRYMISLAADRIYAQNTTITGSIGVMLQSFELTDLAKKLGVNLITLKSSDLKGSPSPFEKLNPNAKKAIMASIKDSYNFFVELVSERRKIDKIQVLKLADGRVYTGRQALKNGLVDAIGDIDQVKEWLKNQDPELEGLKIRKLDLEKKLTPIQKFLSLGSIPDINNMMGLTSLWSPGII